jgi:uncharacterized protein YggE
MYGNPIYNKLSPIQHKCFPTIEVLGEGTVAAAPDRAVVVLGVVTEGTVLQTVQSENAETVTNIINSLLQINIPREQIQTNDFRIEIQYDYIDGQQIFKGYQVTHLLQITIDRVDQTGMVVDTAVSHGANTVTSIQFSIYQREKYENQALALAIHNARQKAVTIANTLGVSIAAVPGKVQELSPTVGPIPFRASILSDAAVTPIEPGELTVNAAVQVLYLIV